MNISSTFPRNSLSVLFAYPFRVFFLSLAIWAVIVVLLWVPAITGWLQLPTAVSVIAWHQHEMLFGLLEAAIAGFLLTAVCVWTQTERLHGISLMLLWLVWLTGRLVITFGAGLPLWLVAGINLLFLPLVMVDAGWRIWRARQIRQLIILVAISLLWLLQIGFFARGSQPFIAAALIATALLMLVIGGRITPMFSANWLRAHGGNPDRVRTFPRLEGLVIGGALLLLVLVLSRQSNAAALTSLLLAVAVTLRLAAWRGWLVWREPLLWILHLSILWISIALLLFAASSTGLLTSVVWQHAMGIGAMGGLILGVISRVSLGHTGRALKLPSGMVSAFVLLHCGAVIRVLVAIELLPWRAGIFISGLCWILAFALFCVLYTSILCRPRVDGKPG